MYEFLGLSLILAGLMTLHVPASFLTTLVWRALGGWTERWTAASRARALFTLRVLPAAIALFGALLLLAPAYLIHEPRHAAEAVSLKLGALAALSAAGILLALWRGASAYLTTRALVGDWMKNARPIDLGLPIPAYELRHSFPVIAVVGIFRPRLFIADHLFDALTRDELAAAIAHECGHLASRDNLKRAVLRVCRDVLTIVPSGRSLDRAWAHASEEAADEYAARNGGPAALDLASALVKIARVAPAGASPLLPAGTMILGESVATIAGRVQRLTRIASAEAGTTTRPSRWSIAFFRLLGAALAIAGLSVAADSSALAAIHRVIETAVSSLQ
ncbi:MAG: M56 family metallopeptidase [Blastocatellia bacterium]|nr:M56 family metallopeptidase [Blastocatellia bacterium]